ncbi:MAG: flagellar hook basal-body protein [Clostridiales bacterium]|nr:flagellar hook basal-body protein [Clostridiales bacterium]MCF8021700.1 flagellar hook basal-body protein [Clostridiales bacterium]
MQYIFNNGVSGVISQSNKIDTIANNIANANTKAYKSQDTFFSSLVYQKLDAIIPTPEDKEVFGGSGTAAAGISRDFTQGQVVKSNNPYSLAVNGKGFFKVADSEGNKFYTRDGSFYIDIEKGRLVNDSGYHLSGVQVDNNSSEIQVRDDGTVESVSNSGENVNNGQIKLYTFSNPQGLEAKGENLFSPGTSSGEVQENVPGDNGAGKIKQGFLEISNTEITKDMAELVESQRALDMNTKTIKIADQLWNMAINMRR